MVSGASGGEFWPGTHLYRRVNRGNENEIPHSSKWQQEDSIPGPHD